MVALGDSRPNAIPCKTCNELVFEVEHPRVDNYTMGQIGSNWSNLFKADPDFNNLIYCLFFLIVLAMHAILFTKR